jgi:hypothetical protein
MKEPHRKVRAPEMAELTLTHTKSDVDLIIKDRERSCSSRCSAN